MPAPHCRRTVCQTLTYSVYIAGLHLREIKALKLTTQCSGIPVAMANYKASKKGELVAIYRLEFYKNQKKWKFCKNDKKIKKHISSKQKLNETYQVEDESPPVDAPAPLDDAFLETDSDENVKETPKAEPRSRRRWSTILDLKIEPDDYENEDWAIPVKPAVRGCWQPSVERPRSYEDQCEGAGGTGGGEGFTAAHWGDLDQVYASELSVTPGQYSRLPVFAGWVAADTHTAPVKESNILNNILQNVGQKTARNNVAETLRRHIENIGQNVGRPGPELAHMNQSLGRNLYDHTRMGNLRLNLTQNLEQLGYYEHDFKQNIDRTERHYVQNLASFGQNGNGLVGQNGDFGQNEYVGKNMDSFEQNVKFDLEQCEEVLECEDMEWEERAGAGAGAGGWLQGPLAHFYSEPALGEALSAPPCACDVSFSSGDSAAFMRGAHARAHSSELDLVKDTKVKTDVARAACGCACACACALRSSLPQQSTRALRAALRAHAHAARNLLAELRKRAHDYNTQPCPRPPSPDASVPTRDEPPPPHSPPPPHNPPPPPPPHLTDTHPLPGRGRGRRLTTK
ncbi:uncharacterized protein LOC128681438 isoform X3 [Plodia interpunctella]|uniref:uncharacterized protein LOC128681438 isoform X3 n=1 Tax=Plodia interpunctella TaxID=58824 RepID=UPI002368A8F9|nr:uncharacterized protein LOC128681438 isoform X3 [Plodia interpunctella]